ncbi:replication-relaxation family protein [Streptomyces sp. NPDC060333]|uniref:replication-relaxation family protein n=1 Tax=Streptomyces sp. NPDC060333 TaxID=3347098 RepID=UPI0036476F05
MCPGTADAATVRGGCKDLEAGGLVVSAGRATRVEPDGRRITEKLWSLTPAGLEAAAVVLDRVAREMGGTAKAAAASGAKHAVKVTDTLAAFLQTPPEPTVPVVRRGAVPAPAAAPVERPPGLGPIAAWSTEVPLPVTWSFAAPGRGSVRADMVFTAPHTALPLLFVEVDNGMESPPILAEKIARYRRFLARSVPQTGRATVGGDVALWRTVWTTPAAKYRDAHPPLAIVFTKKMAPAAMETRIREAERLSVQEWRGHWHTAGTHSDGTKDGYRDYTGVVPVIVTVLDLLEEHGPHGPIWRRYGRRIHETLADALANPDDYHAYSVREEKRRAADEAERQREEREHQEERQRRDAAAGRCRECGRKVYPDDAQGTKAAGGLCDICRHRADHDAEQARELAERQAAAEADARLDGPLGWIRALRSGGR